MKKHQIEWVLEDLRCRGNLGKRLSSCINGLDFKKAKFFPSEVEECDFRYAVPFKSKSFVGFNNFVDMLVCGLRFRPSSFCLFYECDFQRGDPCVIECPISKVFLGQEVYYLIDSDMGKDEVVRVVEKASKNLFMCEFCWGREKWCNGLNFLSGCDVDFLLANALVSVAFGICDDEGYLQVPFNRQADMLQNPILK